MSRGLLLSLTALLITSKSLGYQVRGSLTKADLVVVAEVTDYRETNEKSHYGNGTLPVFSVTLKVKGYIAGSGPETLNIAIESGAVENFGYSKTGILSINVGQTSVWFLQHHPKGEFQSLTTREDVIVPWPLPSFRYAPLDLAGRVMSQIVLDTPRFTPQSHPLVSIADLFLRNAFDGPNRARFLQLLVQVSPDQIKSIGWEVPVPNEDPEASKKWFLETAQPVFEEKPDRLVDLLALRIFWGIDKDARRFVEEYEKAPHTLYGFPPRIQPAHSLRIAAVAPHGIAAAAFINLKRAPELKEDTLQLALQRVGEDQSLDWAILETVSTLFDRPELNPVSTTHYSTREEILEKIEKLKVFARTMVSPP